MVTRYDQADILRRPLTSLAMSAWPCRVTTKYSYFICSLGCKVYKHLAEPVKLKNYLPVRSINTFPNFNTKWHHILPYIIYHHISYPIISYHIISYHITSYHIISKTFSYIRTCFLCVLNFECLDSVWKMASFKHSKMDTLIGWFYTVGEQCILLYGPCMTVPHKWTKICWLATAN